MKKFLFIIAVSFSLTSFAQQMNEEVYNENVKTIQLYLKNNQAGYPIISLGSLEAMELRFDDLDDNVKNYYYTYQLCNSDWTPTMLSSFDYIKGFAQQRLNQYRVSSVSKTNYVHYSASLPDKNAVPSKSGNYILKVFLNGNQNDLVFTKRFLVVDNFVDVTAQLQQPFDPALFRTHQKLNFTVSKKKLNVINPQQQVKVTLLQNFRWDNAAQNLQPTFIKPDFFEFNPEQDAVFPGGKEYRWVDLRSFRFKSDRIDSNNLTTTPFEITLKPDPERTKFTYLFYADRNGFYEVSSTDLINPFWQGDYANVKFTFVPTGNQPYANKKLYIAGAFSNYEMDEKYEMEYNAEKGIYEKELYLKQGYYTYTYLTKENNKKQAQPTVADTEGNYWETENDYTVLVYYRDISGRHDQLVAVKTINSRSGRVGLSN